MKEFWYFLSGLTVSVKVGIVSVPISIGTITEIFYLIYGKIKVPYSPMFAPYEFLYLNIIWISIVFFLVFIFIYAKIYVMRREDLSDSVKWFKVAKYLQMI